MWTKGTDALEGELQSSSEVDFYIDQVKKKNSYCDSNLPQNVRDVFDSLTQNECKVTPTTHQITG